MRTKNEKYLILVLAAIIFLGGNYYGYSWLAQKQKSLRLTEAGLKADQAEAKVDLAQSDTWTQRQAWIRDHEPALGDLGESQSALLNFVVKKARDNKLEVTDQNLSDVQRGAAGTQLNVRVKVKGSMQDLCKWLADLQKPDQFYAVASFTLSADQDQKSMLCSVMIARYFKEGS